MAHFAQLDENNIVLQVIVISNQEILSTEGVEEEALGIAWCHRAYGPDTKWVQTSYNGTKRKNYAAPGDTYNEALDAFIRPQPFPSWTLDERACAWLAPVPLPTDGQPYYWDEATLSWVLIEVTE